MPSSHPPQFTYSSAMSCEIGITRRDPSPVIWVEGLYYVYYSRSTADYTGYNASLYYATSLDGFAWTERGEILPKGGPGAFDEHAVFTPTTLIAGGKYYLIYDAVPEPFTNDNGGPNCTPTAMGIAVADHPAGPFRRSDQNPILKPSPGQADRFDSLRVDDSCVVVRDGKYWLYYKGRPIGGTPRQTRMGLAIAEHPEGPYRKVAGDDPALHGALVDGGHEVCCWPHGSGVAALFCNVGPGGNTLQYSADGIHFQVVCRACPPCAPGPFRADHYQNNRGPGITWGLCIADAGGPWPYLKRFDCNLGTDQV